PAKLLGWTARFLGMINPGDEVDFRVDRVGVDLGGEVLEISARAMLLAGTDRQARADALTGLAADAHGLGRFAASATLLAQASDAVTDDVPRLAIRLAWVGAELAMATGDGATALRRAERGVELAADFASVRHRVKSAVVLAAARCAAGDLDGAREGADAALTDTETHGLVPLRWALASLLAGIGSSRPPEQIAEIRDTAARAGHQPRRALAPLRPARGVRGFPDPAQAPRYCGFSPCSRKKSRS
ncbi:hypothetical protein H7H37_20300, partial [Mycolicibacterium insubricum]|nr:hypothetical protein [Mycolicibacterium insubricum]